jgi:hypothetical protein
MSTVIAPEPSDETASIQRAASASSISTPLASAAASSCSVASSTRSGAFQDPKIRFTSERPATRASMSASVV